MHLNELDEIRKDEYDCAKSNKDRMKKIHDRHILKRSFSSCDKVLLYNSRLHLFPGKLRSCWTGPFLARTIYPYGAVEIENLQGVQPFKVNGQRLKLFLDLQGPDTEELSLGDPVYQQVSTVNSG